MQIPEALQHFPHTALLIACDSVHARFFLLGGDQLEELDAISLPREKRQDAEGAFTSADGSRVAGPSADISDDHRLHEFIHAMIERTTELLNQQEIAHLHLVMPAEIEHAYSSHLEPHVATKILKRVHLDLANFPPLDILERLIAA